MLGYEGTYTYSLDHKGRLFIPAEFRKRLPPEANGTLVATKGYDGCISLFPLDKWGELEKSLRSLPVNKMRVRVVLRTLLSRARRIPIDSQGRIKIPQDLLDYANLTDEAVIIGALDWIEVWSPEAYKEWDKEAESNFAEYLESLNLGTREFG